MSIETSPVIERDAKGRPLPPPGLNPVSLKYAAIVPILAVAMLVVIILVQFVFDGQEAPTKTTLPSRQATSGLTVAPVRPFSGYLVAGEPVADINKSVVIPEGSTFVAAPITGGEATSYDRTLTYRSSATEGALYSFFDSEMRARGWRVFSVSAPVGQKGVQLLAQKSGTDGWFWEQGVTISPTTFTSQNVASTKFSVRLYQASDDD